MFTGIVQGTGLVVAIEEKSNFRTHVVELPIDMLPELALGRQLLTMDAASP